jgi:ubiquinone/menaquinone biosynthesis C-methylase UbiE
MDRAAYHRRELQIALDPHDPGHIPAPPIAAGQRILDIGCGAGQTLIASYSGNPCFGMDIDFEALRLSRSLGCSAPMVAGRAETLPFGDASFDAVIARVSLPYTDLPRSLVEIRRVLRTGGFLWMVSHSLSVPWSAVRPERPRSWLFFSYITMNGLLFHISGRVFPCLGRYESFQTVAGIRRALTTAGFCDIRTESCLKSAEGRQLRLLLTTAVAA